MCQQLCGKKVKVSVAMVASGILFPLLVWGGYALLPFDPPLVLGTPLRVVYTLRCSFFATIPIVLGETRSGAPKQSAVGTTGLITAAPPPLPQVWWFWAEPGCVTAP